MERVTSLMTSQMMLQNLETAQSTLTATSNEVSTGLKITQPSDDPFGTGLVLQLQGQASALNSYSTSVNDATAWGQSTTTALNDVSNVVQRVRELVMSAANGTTNSSDLQDDATEVGQLIDEVKSDANTQYNGQYIFAGTATSTAPYQAGANDAYQGNTNAVSRQIGPGTTIQANTDISQLLGSGQAAGDGKLLDTLRTIQQDMTSGNASALGGTDLTNLDGNISTLGQMQTNVGSTLDRLTQASSRIQDLQTQNTTMLGDTENVDMATAMTAYTTQQAAYTAALQATASILQQPSLMNFLN